MTNSSNPKNNGYGRFIPREEVQSFAAWTPDAIGAKAGARKEAAAAPTGPTAEEMQALLHAQRQAGYQDGYRDGLAALEGFKQSYAQAMTAQIGALLESFDAQMLALEQQMAQAVTRTSTELARQVVRVELQQRPEIVAQVAEDAVNAVLHSARHIRVTVHPDDHLLVVQGAAEALESRGARLSVSSAIERGGCVVESDVGSIDARIETRWAQAAKTLGAALPFCGEGGDA